MIRRARMKRLLLVLAAATLPLLPGAARAAACSPLDCAPSQFTLAHGTLLAYRHTALGPIRIVDLRSGERRFTLPGGFVARDVLVHQAGMRLEWYDAASGRRTGSVTLPFRIRLAGTSQDGSRAVGFFGSTVVIATPDGVRKVALPGGIWDFDALRGDKLFLIKTFPQGGYQIRLYDLARRVLVAKPLKDPHESATIWGVPVLAARFARRPFPLHALHRVERRGDGARARSAARDRALYRPAGDRGLRVRRLVGARAPTRRASGNALGRQPRLRPGGSHLGRDAQGDGGVPDRPPRTGTWGTAPVLRSGVTEPRPRSPTARRSRGSHSASARSSGG